MILGAAAGKLAGAVATGLVGAAAWDGAKRVARRANVRGVAVGALAAGLRGVRAAEVGAEKGRLATADLMAEARERIGESASPPAAGGHTHEH